MLNGEYPILDLLLGFFLLCFFLIIFTYAIYVMADIDLGMWSLRWYFFRKERIKKKQLQEAEQIQAKINEIGENTTNPKTTI